MYIKKLIQEHNYRTNQEIKLLISLFILTFFKYIYKIMSCKREKNRLTLKEGKNMNSKKSQEKKIVETVTEKKQKEETKGKLISELTTKLAQNPKNSAELESAVLGVYDSFVHTEERNQKIFQRFEIEPNRAMRDTCVKKLVEEIKACLNEIEEKTSNVTVDENTQLEQLKEIYKELILQLDGVGYSAEIAKDFPKLDDLNKQQMDRVIKRRVYDKVQDVLQNAKIQKYTQQKSNIQEEKVNFWGKLIGKEQLKEARLRNLDLKIQLAQKDDLQEKENYSIREMLTDIYNCTNKELEGKSTPEIQKLYDAINMTYGEEEIIEDKNRTVTTNIEESAKGGSLVVLENHRKIFGKTKAQAKIVELENQGLQQQLLKRRTINSVRSNKIREIRRK